MRRTFLVLGMVVSIVGNAWAKVDPKENPIEIREVVAQDIKFDITTGEIKYTLPESSLVRIRIGLRQGGPLLRTLIDWQWQEKGEHVEHWDLKDESGVVDLTGREDAMMTLLAVAAPTSENAEKIIAQKGHHRSPKFEITFPGLEIKNNEPPVLSNVVPIRVTIDPADAKWLTESKYEMTLYIDNTFIQEDEHGMNPYNYQFNTRGINNGRHTLIANVIGFNGEMATKTIAVVVQNEP